MVIRTTIRNQNVASRATIDDSDESKVSFDLSFTALVLDLVPGVDEGSYERKRRAEGEVVEKVILKNGNKQCKIGAS